MFKFSIAFLMKATEASHWIKGRWGREKEKIEAKIKTHNTADIILSFHNENENGNGMKEEEREREKEKEKMLMAVIFQEVVY